MAAPPAPGGAPITDRRQLIDHVASGAKAPGAWRIGTEHEKFVFDRNTLAQVPYDGPTGIRTLLEGLVRYGWEPVLEKGNPIALTKGRANITLEPGGQFELSGAPLETLHETDAETRTHIDEVKTVARGMGVGLVGLGFQPKWRREDITWMPKGRYAIMRRYMPTKGKLGLDMMIRTCTVQVNLDYESEADMVRKFRVALALQPVATAMFANSPFLEGKPTGYLSYRSHVWEDTDPDRSGMLPFVFEPGMGYERYVEYMLDVPMYFVYRDGVYIDASGQSFRDFLNRRLPALLGEMPTITDWVDHMTTAFPEVRLKRYLEMRGADSGPVDRLAALPALWVGLLYDRTALDAAAALVADWTDAERAMLRREAPRLALATPFRHATVRAVAEQVLAIARDGLVRRARRDAAGQDESKYLAPLFAIVARGLSPAEVALEQFRKEWGGSVDPVFEAYAY
ncbi:MAG: glutamate--cysteine ligase [Alphaproteobacteria bacterium]|nr:glutamate--cysteine ligase [Alphaproteobacteria bacterium]